MVQPSEESATAAPEAGAKLPSAWRVTVWTLEDTRLTDKLNRNRAAATLVKIAMKLRIGGLALELVQKSHRPLRGCSKGYDLEMKGLF